jgi:uncharacterized protein involved in type VI secretion and phage assembly
VPLTVHDENILNLALNRVAISLLHQPAFLTFSPTGSGIHGIVYRVAQGESGKRLTRYHVSLRPQLSYLVHRTNQRIFQHLSAPKIIAKVLEEHGIQGNAYQFQLGALYPERDYCVQYDESDLHFVQRLCEEEGNVQGFVRRSSATPRAARVRCTLAQTPAKHCLGQNRPDTHTSGELGLIQ